MQWPRRVHVWAVLRRALVEQQKLSLMVFAGKQFQSQWGRKTGGLGCTSIDLYHNCRNVKITGCSLRTHHQHHVCVISFLSASKIVNVSSLLESYLKLYLAATMLIVFNLFAGPHTGRGNGHSFDRKAGVAFKHQQLDQTDLSGNGSSGYEFQSLPSIAFSSPLR